MTAFDQGAAAFAKGVPFNNSPHSLGTFARREWRRGWEHAARQQREQEADETAQLRKRLDDATTLDELRQAVVDWFDAFQEKMT